MEDELKEGENGLGVYLTPLSAWALSFGCAVGWGAFVMPGTTFLPTAGPLGSSLGILIGAVLMFIIGMNYHYLMNKYPDAGGTLTYTIKTFGYDHGFLSAWFLILVYIAIIWANASAFTLIGRNLFGSVFQYGFHYQILGNDIYLGEVLLSMAAIFICGMVCIISRQASVVLQVLFALVLFGGIVVCAYFALGINGGESTWYRPLFEENGRTPAKQVFTIIALSPWAFVGFESISNSTRGFRFPVKKSIWIITASLITASASYILLIQLAASKIPGEYKNWSEYIAELDGLNGLKSLPTLFAAHEAIGRVGIIIFGFAAMAAIFTGLIGNYIAASRLLYMSAEDGILPKWFSRVNEKSNPQNALLFIICISIFIPFLGRTAIGWIVDVNTIGATIAYGYTSADAFATARKEKNKKIQITGMIGLLISALFFLYFMSSSAGALSTESYLILVIWSILGFLYFRSVFKRDKEGRFGKSTIVWICLLFLIFFTSLMWMKQSTDDMTRKIVNNVSVYYEERSEEMDAKTVMETEKYLSEQLKEANETINRNSIIEMGCIIVSLAIMFSIYTSMSKREQQMEVEKFKAEESSRAKSFFLSNMSHDIRTPMNAIIGYINLAERDGTDFSQMKEYLSKIKASSHHLLALINDVLEMSRIESGKMDLELVPIDLKKTMEEVYDMFSNQMERKQIDFRMDLSNLKKRYVYCDKNRLNRVLLNLLSNSYKFTPEGGTIIVTLWQIDDGISDYGNFEMRVSDSGIGMTKEFAAKVFEAFERERTSTVSGIQGTGLGMAITKSIIDLMGGTIEVNTAPERGAEFVIRLKLKLQNEKEIDQDDFSEEENEKEIIFDSHTMRLLLVEDMEINREIAYEVLTEMGFAVETAEDGKEAVEKVAASEPVYFNAVLMDIQMPVMDGYDATREIRKLKNKELAKVPILAMTANAFAEDVKKAEEVGMNGHIAKPIDLDDLKKKLTSVLSKRKKN